MVLTAILSQESITLVVYDLEKLLLSFSANLPQMQFYNALQRSFDI